MSSHFFGRLLSGGPGGGGRQGGGHHDDRGYSYGSPSGQSAPGSLTQRSSLPASSAHGCSAAVQRVVVCANCQADNGTSNRFCAKCGQRLGPAEQACKCGATLAPNVKFFPSCGEAAAGTSA